ncbi:MAG: DUF1272 domain-containing protein [Burkholderiales bacterium]
MARLDLRPNCECCDRDLLPASTEAYIWSHECTYCKSCVEELLQGVCPNCHGNLERRPIQPPVGPAGGLSKHPAQAQRVLKQGGCATPNRAPAHDVDRATPFS